MYTVDDRDRVAALDVPQCSVGAPLPVVFAGEHELVIAYVAERRGPGRAGETTRAIDADTPVPVVVVRFERPLAHFFGPPNAEAFSGHPLSPRGLEPHAAFRVDDSSWLRELEVRNRVHPQHRAAAFLGERHHFVFAFRDSTFECIASSFTTASFAGSMREATSEIARRLR